MNLKSLLTISIFLLALGALLLHVTHASAAPRAALTITVDTMIDSNAAAYRVCNASPNNCSLRGAISTANADTANDYTIIVPAGTYTLTLVGGGEDANATGDLDITRSMTITGAGRDLTIINGNGITTGDRVLSINPLEYYDIEVAISGVTISNGTTPGSGGGIYIYGTILNLSNCIITNNSAEYGGGVFNEAGAVSISNCIISQNTANTHAGGIMHDSYFFITMEINNSIISGNTAINGHGGGIESYGGYLVIVNSTISTNYAGQHGGGISPSGGTVSLYKTTVSENVALRGGGIQVGLYPSNTTNVNIYNSSILSNTAGTGAGIRVTETAIVNIVNSTISGNLADGSGGGMSINSGASIILSNVTVAGNHADINNNGSGNGGGINLASSGVTIALKNTIMALNDSHNGSGPACYGTLDSVNYTLISNTMFCTVRAGTGNQLNVNAHLGPLGNYGGATMTRILLSNSPAINAGNPSGCTDHNNFLITTDQRGWLRHVARCDMGAFELNFPIFLPLILK